MSNDPISHEEFVRRAKRAQAELDRISSVEAEIKEIRKEYEKAKEAFQKAIDHFDRAFEKNQDTQREE